MSSPQSDAELARQLATSYEQVEAWRDQDPVIPDATSELFVDDQDWPHMAVSHSAISSIKAAADHMLAVARHIEQRQLFPFAHPSLLRTALLSGAQAVWLLAPDSRETRVANNRLLAWHNYNEHRKYLRDTRSLMPDPQPGLDEFIKNVGKRADAVAALRQTDGQKADFEATRVIEVAAKATWPGVPQAATEARYEWRRASAAAHGLVWAAFGISGASSAGPADAAGVAAINVGGSIVDYFHIYELSYGLVKQAVSLLDQRAAPSGKAAA